MLRCSRLIEEEKAKKFDLSKSVDELERIMLYIPTKIQPGDRMTGWEIIASLPLEEQTSTKTVYPKALSDAAWRLRENDGFISLAFLEALCLMYEWNGTEWKEVKE